MQETRQEMVQSATKESQAADSPQPMVASSEDCGCQEATVNEEHWPRDQKACTLQHNWALVALCPPGAAMWECRSPVPGLLVFKRGSKSKQLNVPKY